VLLTTKVPAGLTAMQALQRKAKVGTRYGGRYVRSIDGVAEDLGKKRSWFWFANGYEADRAATDYRLRKGELEWWDLRSWKHEQRVPVVVGAFPEPFLHGYDGKRRRAIIVGPDPHAVRPLARRLHARVVVAGAPVPARANVLYLAPLDRTRFDARLRHGSDSAGAPVRMLFLGDWHSLIRGEFRYRYRVP
jgi:hypothetical protein